MQIQVRRNDGESVAQLLSSVLSLYAKTCALVVYKLAEEFNVIVYSPNLSQ